jgi:hypothetical protein
MKRKKLPGMFIVTTSSTTVAIPAHEGWNPITEENRGRGSFEVRAMFGTGTSVNLGIQTATDLRNPDATPLTIATARTSDGVRDPDATPTTLSMQDKQGFRYVWLISTTSGAGGCWVAGYADTFQA